MRTLATVVLSRMCRFGLALTGLRKALAVESLLPLRLVVCAMVNPVCCFPFTSRTSYPISFPAWRIAYERGGWYGNCVTVKYLKTNKTWDKNFFRLWIEVKC